LDFFVAGNRRRHSKGCRYNCRFRGVLPCRPACYQKHIIVLVVNVQGNILRQNIRGLGERSE
jgi:hypothetical protein